MLDPDAELVSQAKKGNKAAFGKLVDQHYDMVYALAYGVLKEHEAARDATQDVFLKVFRDLSKFEGKSKFKTWLYRVSINAAVDLARRKKDMDSIDPTDTSGEEDRPAVVIEDKGHNPRDGAAQSELKELMSSALEELSPEHRAILVLREWQGMSYEEIAETLMLEIGTVMSRLFYARKKLGEILSIRMKEPKS